jgi:hypothetical protein
MKLTKLTIKERTGAKTNDTTRTNWYAPLIVVRTTRVYFSPPQASLFALGEMRHGMVFASDSEHPEDWYIHFSELKDVPSHAIHYNVKTKVYFVDNGAKKLTLPPIGNYKTSIDSFISSEDPLKRRFHKLILCS